MKFLHSVISRLSVTQQMAVSNVYWSMLGQTARILSELFVGILVARYLGPEQYGLMSYVISFVTLFSALASFGLDHIEVRELAGGNAPKEAVLGTAFRLRLGFALITMGLIGLAAHALEADADAKMMILMYSFSIFLNSFSVIRNYFTAIVKNKYVVKTEIGRVVIGALIKVAFLLVRAPLHWFVVAVTFDFFLLASGYVYAYCAQIGSVREWRFDREIARYLIRQSFPLLLSGAVVLVYQRIDQIMLRNMLSNAAAGYFSTADKFAILIGIIPAVITQTMSPLLVKARAGNPELYRLRSRQFVGTVLWLTIGLAVGGSVLSYPLIALTFGQQYLPAVPVLRVLAFRAVGMALSTTSGQLIIIEGIQKWAFARNILGCVVCVVLNFILIPEFGAVGSAWASVITVVFTGCVANLLIPPYHAVLRLQLQAIATGWRGILSLRRLLP
jgi:O-antigen/teichoic acid export membrane protein